MDDLQAEEVDLVLFDYIERFGMTEKALRYFLTKNKSMEDQRIEELVMLFSSVRGDSSTPKH